MPVTMFKSVRNIIYKPLSQIINKCFNAGVYPNCLKIGRIIQIYKSGDSTDPTNYRPISTLPYITKIFETCLYNRLVKFFDKFSLLSKFQFGFRKKKSTADAVISLTNYVYSCLNDKKYCASVLIDFRKAFDSISHSILLRKLHAYGVCSMPFKLI